MNAKDCRLCDIYMSMRSRQSLITPDLLSGIPDLVREIYVSEEGCLLFLFMSLGERRQSEDVIFCLRYWANDGGMRAKMKRRVTENGKLYIMENEDPVLCMREEINGDSMLVTLEGAISLTAAHDFEDEMMAIMTVSRQMILDFEKVTYISAPGFQTLLTLQKIIDENSSGMLKLTHINETLLQSFREIGFDALFEIE